MRSDWLSKPLAMLGAAAAAACAGSAPIAPLERNEATSLDEAKLQAAASGRPILVDVYADW